MINKILNTIRVRSKCYRKGRGEIGYEGTEKVMLEVELVRVHSRVVVIRDNRLHIIWEYRCSGSI